MKITVVYQADDIKRLVLKDLQAQGIRCDMGALEFSGKPSVTVKIDASTVADVEAPTPLPDPVIAPAAPATEPDLGDILASSKAVEVDRPGIYPKHKMLDGESAEWPGAPEPRGR
jgi:hypothetical protein